GRTGELNSKLLGMVFVMKFQAAAMSRSDIPEEQRVDFSLYVDEFQNFSTDSFATIMSEARKYHLNLIVANQFTTQLTTEIRDAVFGNMGTIVAFRIGQNDVESLGQYFQPTFDGDDLLRVPNYNTIVRTLINGVPTQPFSMATLPALGTPNPRLSTALKQLSSAKYGRPKAIVGKEIMERMATKGEAVPPAGGLSGQSSLGAGLGASRPGAAAAQPLSGASQGVSRGAAAAPKTGSSFLDEWLHKRKTGVVSSTPPAQSAQPPVQPAQTSPVSAQPSTAATAAPLAATPTISKHQARNTMQQPADVTEPILAPSVSSAPVQPKTDQPRNISSDELEQSEVHDIAAKLKQDLDSPAPTPAPTPAPAPAAKKTEHTADLDSAEGDTIIIGRDGSFQHADESDLPEPK
ncbi:MAG: type IV secretory system conjugative DNA transfer family protein, partial [Patescibacteria group bacterium]